MRRGLNIAALATASVMLVCTSCGEYTPIEPDIPTLDVFPDSVDVEVSCSQEFDAGFEGAPHVVRWYVDDVVGGDPRTGMITTTGTYVAPANASGSGFVTVRAQSLEDPAMQGTATVRITASPSNAFVIVSPETSTVRAGGSRNFGSTVSGCGSDSVIWSLEIVSGISTSGLGGIGDDGVYQAPATSNA